MGRQAVWSKVGPGVNERAIRAARAPIVMLGFVGPVPSPIRREQITHRFGSGPTAGASRSVAAEAPERR